MKTTISLKIEVLEEILKQAKEKANRDSDCSNGTIEIKQVKPAKWHNGNDDIQVFMQSNFSECNSKFLCQSF